jgi:uncharacterized protein YndB with AHSA1/START domain
VERGFTLKRVLDAPRELVFQAWTDPEHLQWFFNDGQAIPPDPIVVDLRVGGEWQQKMIINDDVAYITGGIYREIVPVERLVFTWGAVGGWPAIDRDHPENDLVVTVTFNALGEKAERTEMFFQLAMPAHFSDERVREWLEMGIRGGWSGTIDRLVVRFHGNASSWTP